jgi:hypothetical protein
MEHHHHLLAVQAVALVLARPLEDQLHRDKVTQAEDLSSVLLTQPEVVEVQVHQVRRAQVAQQVTAALAYLLILLGVL